MKRSSHRSIIVHFLRLVILFTISCFPSTLDPDTSLTLTFQGQKQCIPATPSFYKSGGIGTSTEGAIHGLMGIRIDGARQNGYWFWKTGAQKDAWCRFYVRIDSIFSSTDLPAKQLDSRSIIGLLAMDVCERLQPDAPSAFLILALNYAPEEKKPTFNLLTQDSAIICSSTTIAPLELKRPYCIEINTQFADSNRVFVTLFIDGAFARKVRFAWPYPNNFIKVVIGGEVAAGRYLWTRSFDDLSLSDNRIYGIPNQAQNTHIDRSDDSVWMVCSTYQSSFDGETISAAEWRLFDTKESHFPLFYALENRQKFFSRKPIPFSLDSGKYCWQVRYINKSGNAGDWSVADTFYQTWENRPKVKLLNCFLSKEMSGPPLAEIKPGDWYWFNIAFERRIRAFDLSYLLIELNNDGYLSGHPGNKGGVFEPTSNFVYNVSLQDGVIEAFEKNIAHSIQSAHISSDSIGLYLDGRKQNIVLDTISNQIHFRGRLLDSAKNGLWRLSAILYYVEPETLNVASINQKTIKVVQSTRFIANLHANVSKSNSHYTLILGLAVLLGLSGFIIFRLRFLPFKPKQAIAVNDDGEYQMLVNHIKEHLKEKLLADNIRKEMKLSTRNFHLLLKRNKTTLPKLINEVRINQAKNIIENNREKSFTEVGYEVGFRDPFYFSYAFKVVTGQTPKKFKTSLGSIKSIHPRT